MTKLYKVLKVQRLFNWIGPSILAHPVIHFYLPGSETSNQPVEFHLGVFWTPKSDLLQKLGVPFRRCGKHDIPYPLKQTLKGTPDIHKKLVLTLRWPVNQNALGHILFYSGANKTPLALGLSLQPATQGTGTHFTPQKPSAFKVFCKFMFRKKFLSEQTHTKCFKKYL